MATENNRKFDPSSLRKEAEKLARESGSSASRMTHDEIMALTQELEIHQIELQLQNEELLRSQAELQESRDRYLDLYDYAPTGYFTLSRHAIILQANLTACQMLKTERASLLSARFTTFISPASADAYYRCVKHCVEVRENHNCEVLMHLKDGSSFWAYLQMVFLPDNEQLRVSMQDITQQKQAQDEAGRLARQWQETFDAIPDLISVHDRDFNIVLVNRAFVERMGVTAEQVIGKKCYQVFHNTDSPVIGCPHKQTLFTGQSEREEIYEPAHRAYYDVATSPIIGPDGAVTATVHHARDITAAKSAQLKIDFQSRVLDALEDVVIVTDLERRIIFSGNGVFNQLGWRPEELIGKNAVDIFVPLEAEEQAHQIIEALLAGESWSGELAARHRDGSIKQLLVMTSPFKDDRGNITGIIGLGKDITDIREAEKIKDEFLGLVSHELRTPMTAILGSLKSAMIPDLPREYVDELIGIAASSAESLHRILENMLELSRHQADRLQLSFDSVDIAEVALGVVDSIRGSSDKRQIFDIDFPADLPAVRADWVRVERILYNLLENAVKYSPPQSRITVSAGTEGEFVVTSVKDEGPGISAADREKLFEQFERLGASGSEGFGLGLVVCRRLVEAQGGWIKVDSEPGKGAVFSFALPVYKL